MAGEINFLLTGDAQRLIKAYEDLIKRQEKEMENRRESAKRNKELREENERARETEKRLAEEQRKRAAVMKDGERVTSSVMTLTERYNRSVEETRRLHMAGAISTETLKRKLKELRENYVAASNAAEEARRKQNSFFATDTGKAVSAIGQMAAGYLSIQTAVGAITGAWREKVSLQERSAELIKSIAAQQETAAFNFANMSPAEQEQMLAEAGRIQQKTQFPRKAVLTEALGVAQSTGADAELSRRVVEELAPITRNRTSMLPGLSVGVINTMKALRTDDVRSSAGLLMGIMGQSNVREIGKLSRAMGPVMRAAVGDLPMDAAPDQVTRAAIAGGAGFAALTKGAADETGESSTTAFIQLRDEMNKFFGNLPTELSQRQAEVKKLLESDKQTELELLEIERAQVDVAKARQKIKDLEREGDKSDEGQLALREARVDLKLREEKAKAVEAESRMTDEQRQRVGVLTKEIEDLSKLSGKNLPNFDQQVTALQGAPALAEMFRAKPIGERRFQLAFQQITTPGSQVAQEFAEFLKGLSFDPVEFAKQERARRGTPEMRVSEFSASAEALEESRLTGERRGVTQVVAETVQGVFQSINERRGLVDAAIRSSTSQPLALMAIRQSQSPEQALQRGIGALQGELMSAAGPFMGPTAIDAESAKELGDAIKLLVEELRLRNVAPPGAGARAQVPAAEGAQ